MISVSGYRFRLKELSLGDIEGFASKFASFTSASKVAVGMDTRASSPMLKDYIEAILLSLGVDVMDYGVLPTPALFREVRDGIEAGLIITASHNPPDWNGIKPVYKGRGLFEDELSKMLECEPRALKGGGRLFGSTSSYVEEALKFAGIERVRLRIGVDLAGGAGIGFAERMLRSIGAKVLTLNSSKGISSRGPDPTSDALDELRALVIMNGLDLGFAFDLDADRLVVVDGRGRKLDGDETLMLCLLYMLERGSRSFSVSIDTSAGVEELADEYGAKVYRSKVGEANVVKSVIEHGCDAGGEGSSGGFIPAGFNYCRDGMLASMLIAKMVDERGQVSGLLRGLPSYKRVRFKARMSRERARKAIRALFERYGGDLSDGLKIGFGERWVLIRSSNTEDVVRVSVEAKELEDARALAERFIGEVVAFAG